MEANDIATKFANDVLTHEVLAKHRELSPGLMLVQFYFLSGMNMEVAVEMFESVKSRAEALKEGVNSKIILEEVMKDLNGE